MRTFTEKKKSWKRIISRGLWNEVSALRRHSRQTRFPGTRATSMNTSLRNAMRERERTLKKQHSHSMYHWGRVRVWIGWASVLKPFSAGVQDFVDCALWGKEDDSKLEQRLKPRSDTGKKARLIRKRKRWGESGPGCFKRDQRRDLVRTKIKRWHDWIETGLPCSSSLLECPLASNIQSWAFPPCFALPFSPFVTWLKEYKDFPVVKLWVLPQIQIPMKTWPKGIERSCGAY